MHGSSDKPRVQRDGLDETIDLGVERAPPPVPRPAGDFADLRVVDPSNYARGEQLARGGMGRVFAARDLRLGRDVAIKELLPTSAGMSRRFELEARITARLQHPSVVSIYEAGVWPSGEPFYAMRLVAGRTLDRVVAETRTVPARLALLPNVLAVADALAYAHTLRIIHRDLKPANVVVGEFGETVVIDWGLAIDLTDGAPHADETEPGGIVGTPAYMAPEQARGDSVDERADVYAIGALLFHVLSGEPPFAGSTADEIIARVKTEEPPVEDLARAGVPTDLLAIVRKAMAARPADRYATAAALAKDLKAFMTGQLVAAHVYSRRDRFARFLRRNRRPLAVATAATIVLAATAAVSVQRIIREREVALHERAEAERHRAIAERRTTELLVERGRQELVLGHAGRALVYLAEAMRDPEAAAASRLLVAEAVRAFAGERVVLDGHARLVRVAAFSADGRIVLTASYDGTARIWDASTGRALAAVQGNGPVQDAAFAHDGRSFAIVCESGEGAIFSVDGTAVARLVGHDASVHRVRFDREGGHVVTAGADGTAIVWDARTGARLATLRGHGEKVLHAEFSHDGKLVVTASIDATAMIWDWRKQRAIRTLAAHRDAVETARFSEDDRRVVTASRDFTAIVWDVATGSRVTTLQGHAGELSSAVFRRDGLRVATASIDASARVWDASTGRLIASMTGHSDGVSSVVYSPDQQRIVTASYDGSARIWDGATGVAVATFEGHRGTLLSAELSPDGARILTGGVDGTARIWAADDQYLLFALEDHKGALGTASFDPGGGQIVTGGSDKTVRVFDSTGHLTMTAPPGSATVFRARFDRDGGRIAVASGDRGACVIDAKNGDVVAVHPGHHGDVYAAAFSPDGLLVATAGHDGEPHIWLATTGALVKALPRHGTGDSVVNSIAFSADGRLLVTASTDGTARINDVDTGEVVHVIRADASLHAAAFSPDGTRVVTAGADRAQVWSLPPRSRPPRPVVALAGHTGAVHWAEFDRTGELIVTASADKTARVWDARTGKELAKRAGHAGTVVTAAFDPTAERIVTASEDGTARVWRLERDTRTPEELAAFVAARVPWRLVEQRGLVPVFEEQP